MIDREKLIEILKKAKMIIENWVPMFEQYNTPAGIDDAIDLLKEQKELIDNLEQEIRDKNKRLKERAQQVDTMLKEREAVEPIVSGDDGSWWCQCGKCKRPIDYEDRFCRNCGQAVKWE